jgi:hypothetical protein
VTIGFRCPLFPPKEEMTDNAQQSVSGQKVGARIEAG